MNWLLFFLLPMVLVFGGYLVLYYLGNKGGKH